jgi:hypothetical protein
MPLTAVSAAAEPPATSKLSTKRKWEDVHAKVEEGEETSASEVAVRSAIRALLQFHGNGGYTPPRDAGRTPGVPHTDIEDYSREDGDGVDDGSLRVHHDSAMSVLAEHLTGLGFRVGKSVPTSSPSSSTNALTHSAAVSVYRDSMSMITNAGAAKEVEESAVALASDRTSVRSTDQERCRAFWILLLGMHPHQSKIEQAYRQFFREEYCLLLLLDMLRDRLATRIGAPALAADAADAIASAPIEERAHDQRQVKSIEVLQTQCLDLMLSRLSNGCFRLSRSSSNEVDKALRWRMDGEGEQADCCEFGNTDGDDIVDVPSLFDWLHAKVFAGGASIPLCTVGQLRAEHARIFARNSTLSNAYLQLWQHRCRVRQSALHLTRLEYHASPNPKFERFKLFVFASSHIEVKRRQNEGTGLTLLPCLPQLVNQGIDATTRYLVELFWEYLDRFCHYQSTCDLRRSVSPSLSQLFSSGLLTASSPSCISLEAQFSPRHPFSLYLHGEPGTGKSSFVRCFARALQRVLHEEVDPSIAQLDTVKQMLNKPMAELELDLELRRNNNDLSLSSLLMSRRQRNRAFCSADPTSCLVVLALEELAPPLSCTFGVGGGAKFELDNPLKPNQHATLKLLTQRLAGRSGTHTMDSHVRSNGVVRSGISGYPSILALMTSNYELTDASAALLRQVPLFENISVIAMKAVEDLDRRNFALSYFNRFVREQLHKRCGQSKSLSARRYLITLDLQEGWGDVRPLVRRLRMLAYYVAAHLTLSSRKTSGRMIVKVAQLSDDRCTIELHSEVTKATLELLTGSVSDLYVTSIVSPSFCRPETRQMLESKGLLFLRNTVPCAELVMFFEFWLSGALAPAVVLSTREKPIKEILSSVSRLDEVHVLTKIDVCSYRMMKSLYDPVETPNLRDDIRRLGRNKPVVVELLCRDVASQLCVREMIEDTPSMTAYSSDRSALRKEGLLFLVRIMGSAISPEIRSRASMIL